jgi:hypothetical protein
VRASASIRTRPWDQRTWDRSQALSFARASDKFDATYELTGYGPGAPRAENFDPRRPTTNAVPVKPPSDSGSCAFENCLVDRFMFHTKRRKTGQSCRCSAG